jgi:hypothetical protein
MSAALRHVRDAEHLLASGPHRSIEQALHLAGYGPECARKACIDEAIADKALGHEFHGAGDPTVGFLLAVDPAASRYGIEDHASSLPLRETHWNVQCRYMATGSASLPNVTVVVAEARAFVDRCVAELWCDGVLPRRSLQ